MAKKETKEVEVVEVPVEVEQYRHRVDVFAQPKYEEKVALPEKSKK